ncbi:MAG: hypothetical protein FJX46_13060 [Alphaproteobacteria bacterium]|nr:hypothetical protein [Alphaproteobacteria bacterium]
MSDIGRVVQSSAAVQQVQPAAAPGTTGAPAAATAAQTQVQNQSPRTADSAVTLPPSLTGAGVGEEISGTVIGTGTGGRVILQTQAGTLALVTEPPPPVDSQVTLKILDLGSRLSAQLTSIDGKPLPTPQSASAVLTGLNAQTLFQATGGTNAPATALPALRAGVNLQALVLSDPNAAAAAATQTSGTVQSQQAAAYQAQSGLGAGTRLTLQLIAIQPPGDLSQQLNQVAGRMLQPQSGSPLLNPQGGPVTAKVLTGMGGQMVLSSPMGMIRIDNAGVLPPGTSLTFNVLGGTAPGRSVAQGMQIDRLLDPRLFAYQTYSEGFGSLREALGVLQRADPGLARQLIADRLPQANANLAANILAFAGAVRAGDGRAWLGRAAAQALEKAGRGDLLKRLDDDFRELNKLMSQANPQDWRILLLPFLDGEALSAVRVFTRQNKKKKSDKDDGRREDSEQVSTRVLVDLSLSQLGPMQLDGLLQEQKFDMMVRTHDALPMGMRDDIMALFGESLAITGMAGGILFQTTREFFDPAAELKKPVGGRGGSVVI